MKEVDIVIENALILTLNEHFHIHESNTIIIDGGIIQSITDNATAASLYSPRKKINGKNKLVMPGLINTHTHTGNTIFRGFADDLPLKTWLEKYIFPLEKQFCTAETVSLSAKISIIEMLRSGTTTFNDMYYFGREVAKAAYETGIRAVVSETLTDFPSPSHKKTEYALNYTEELVSEWGNNSLISIGIAPHAIYSCSQKTLQKAKEISEKHNLLFQIHLSETEQEVNQSLRDYKRTPTAYLENIGLLHEGMIAIHSVHLTDEDKILYEKKGLTISHNPQSNMKLASGVAPVHEMIRRGIKVGIGTDGTASNNTLNMFKEMDVACKLQKVFTRDPAALDARTSLQSGTLNAAKVLSLDHTTGSIEKGKRADLIIVGLKQPHLVPLYDIYSQIIFAMNGSEIETVIIDGKIIMEEKILKTIDEDDVIDRVKHLSKKIKKEFCN